MRTPAYLVVCGLVLLSAHPAVAGMPAPLPVNPERVYLKASISLKGLAPGDYDLTIILHDEVAKETSVSQVIKFKVIPPKDPRNEPEARQPHELDSLYAPFVCGFEPDDDD